MTPLRALVLTLAAAACAAPAFRPIRYGDEACAHCHMAITEARFGAELVTRKGRSVTFDDPACLAAYVAAGTVPADQVAHLWVNDFVHPDLPIRAESAAYLRTGRIATPMGGGIIALRAGAEADSVARALGGTPLRWGDLLAAPPHR